MSVPRIASMDTPTTRVLVAGPSMLRIAEVVIM